MLREVELVFSLAYTPAYDPYHTAFRYLVLLSSSGTQSLPCRVARTADFFLCFPWALKDVRAPREIEGFARERSRLVRCYPQTSYDHFPSARIVFERMELIQDTAISALAGAEMVDTSALKSDQVELISNNVSDELKSSIEVFRERAADLITFLVGNLPKIDTHGRNGIYARSGLGEFSYDVV